MKNKELNELLKKRASHRKFLPDVVCEEDIRKMVNSAGLAPSGHNLQPWSFTAIDNKDLINKMVDAIEENLKSLYLELPEDYSEKIEKYKFFIEHFKDAPLVIVVCARDYEYITSKIETKHGAKLPESELFSMTLLGVGAAINNLLLSAETLGYGSCWMTEPIVYAQRDIEKILNVEEPYHFVSLVAIGKPVKDRQGAPKKASEEILTFIH